MATSKFLKLHPRRPGARLAVQSMQSSTRTCLCLHSRLQLRNLPPCSPAAYDPYVQPRPGRYGRPWWCSGEFVGCSSSSIMTARIRASRRRHNMHDVWISEGTGPQIWITFRF
ncbi:hypothetical protein N657DRAFT_100867 [Parathielavia appendiculata]|uniref:Uncharacterized protein n=1 Tax=Parathielavia appendiculata TaxID=2587402 RepID=A0AAN6TXZ9_9PEZI|nr:hypothetical protein N657DRAFT_100867 [Parathielavia appendiculata]